MWKYILKKLLLAIPVLLGITIIDYAIMSLAGSPLDMLVGPRISQGTIAARAAQWGLDQPIYVQYWNWLLEVLRGNLGYSYKSYQPVSELIASHIGPTLLLMGVSMVLGLILAVPAGIYSAVHRYQKRDYAVVSASFLASSIPGFFVALILIYIFTVVLGWLPSSGMITAGTGGDAADIARHMVMPSIVLAVGVAGGNIRYIRSAVLEILEMDYLRTATAKGLGLITMNAVTGRDYPVIMGVCLLSAVVVLASNLLTDILYAVVDPTIKY